MGFYTTRSNTVNLCFAHSVFMAFLCFLEQAERYYFHKSHQSVIFAENTWGRFGGKNRTFKYYVH